MFTVVKCVARTVLEELKQLELLSSFLPIFHGREPSFPKLSSFKPLGANTPSGTKPTGCHPNRRKSTLSRPVPNIRLKLVVRTCCQVEASIN